jgi:hypothetical protein
MPADPLHQTTKHLRFVFRQSSQRFLRDLKRVGREFLHQIEGLHRGCDVVADIPGECLLVAQDCRSQMSVFTESLGG